jgi:hypothetical protein
MQCREFEQRLNDLLDERRSPQADPRLSAHAARCDRCRQLLSGQATLLLGLSQMVTPVPDRNFARRVVAEVVVKPSGVAPRRIWLSLAACLVSAAAMLLTVSLVWYARRSNTTGDGESAGARGTFAIARQRGPNLALMTKPVDGRRRAAGRDRPALTGADLLLEAPRLPEHLRSYYVAIDDLGAALPEAALRLDEVERSTPGIRPLRVSLFMIWDTLCRTIPGNRVDAPPQSRGRTSLWWLEPVRIV